MRRRSLGSGASALLLLITIAQAHNGVHDHLEALHRRHRESRAKRINETGQKEDVVEVVKRGQCAFPDGAGLVPVTPGAANAGWAMSPDQPCQPGSYCPYACPPGQVSQQWDPKATSYSYPQSMNGGLYCDKNGQVSKPFPDRPYCKQTATNIGVVNKAGETVTFCQTVLPGNEAMLIPTAVDDFATLAVPGTDYWVGTAAHYYINPPGTSAIDGCVWGSSSKPLGNWSPYVAGTNTDKSGETFIKLGWNPIYLEPATPFRSEMPTWGVKIDCPDGGCNGAPCMIDPSVHEVNEMTGDVSTGAGGGNFCVVTVPKGGSANFVVFGSGSSNSQGGRFYQSASAAPSSTASQPSSSPSSSSLGSSSSSSPSSSAAPTATTTTTKAKSTTTARESEIQSSSATTTTVESSTWLVWNASSEAASTTGSSVSTTERSGPTGQPYYSLFNTSIPQSATDDTAAPTVGTPTATESLIKPLSTGGAPVMAWNMAALAPLAIWSLLM